MDLKEIVAKRRQEQRQARLDECQGPMQAIDIEKQVRARVYDRPTFTCEETIPPVPEGLVIHEKYFSVVANIFSKNDCYVWGDAGSGKSYLGMTLAMHLNRPMEYQQIYDGTLPSQIYGYLDANGVYHSTPFRRMWENGGILVWDEVDKAGATGACIGNLAWSSEEVSFPDGPVKRHKDCVQILTANTVGSGPTRQYVGARALDKSTLSRFSFIEWGYDEVMEAAISCNKYWTQYVQVVRRVVKELNILHIVSPRASIGGGRLLAMGVPVNEVAQMKLWQGLDEETVDKIIDRAGSPGRMKDE